MTADQRPSVRLIGLMVMDAASVLEAATDAGFRPEWLDGQWSRDCYRVMADMEQKRDPIDPHFVEARAKEMGLSVTAKQLVAAEKLAPSRRNGPDKLIEQIRAEYVAREVKRVAEELGESADPVAAAQEAAQTLLEVTAAHVEEDDHVSVIESQWDMAASGQLPGVPLPWEALYRRVGGPEPGQVSLFVAPGGTGKSRAMNQMARHAALNGWPSLLFSFEDGVKGAMQRQVGMAAGIDPFNLRTGKATEEERARAKVALREIKDIYFCERACRVEGMFSVVQQHIARYGIKFVLVDAFLDIAGDKDTAGMDHTMDGLVHIARRLHVPVMVAHHVRKSPPENGRNDQRRWMITRNDLRGSGRLWDQAKGMVFILQALPAKSVLGNAPAMLDGELMMEYTIDVAKASFGPSGMRKAVAADPVTQEWLEIAPPHKFGA